MSELPTSWTKILLSEVTGDRSPIIYGILQPGPESKGGILYVRPTEIQNGIIQTSELRRTTPEIAARYSRSTLQAGDIILSIVGTIGKVAVVPPELDGGNITQSSCRIRPDRDLCDREWVKFFLKSALATSQYDSGRLGTAVPRLNLADVREFSLPLPPLAEQRRIAAKLDALSAKSARARTELARIKALVSSYKQAVLAKAFDGKLTADWRRSTDWPAPTRLEDAATSFEYGSAAKSLKEGRTPVLRMGNIQQGQLDWSDLVYTDDEEEAQRYRLTSGDVLFNRTNSPALVGKTALFRGEREAIFAGYLIRIVAGPGLRPEYLTYALNSPIGRTFSWDVKTDGVSQSNISATKLKEFSFSIPDIEEQDEIVRRIESAFARIDRLAAEAERALDLLGKLDEAILARAFRGELVPQDENDEPAQVLLDRIRAERASAPKAKRRGRAAAARS